MTDEETYTEGRDMDAETFRKVVAKLRANTIGHRAAEHGRKTYWGKPSRVTVYVKPQHAARLEKFIASVGGWK